MFLTVVAVVFATATVVTPAVAVPPTSISWSAVPFPHPPYFEVGEYSGNLTSYSRCAKINGGSGPRGYGTKFRPINTDNARFWQTVKGPRSSYTRYPQGAPEDLWRFLGGAAQVFASFRNRAGHDVSYTAAVSCVLWTNNTDVAQTGFQGYATGVMMAPGVQSVLAYNRSIPELHPLPVTPVLLGMTPGLKFPIDNTVPWETTNISFAAPVADNLLLATRKFAPTKQTVNASAFDVSQWTHTLPTRLYDEQQCRTWLDENLRLEQEQTDPIALTGILSGSVSCDLDQFSGVVIQNLATQVSFSPNVVEEPLTVAQALFLVIVPALWEVVITSVLLYVRLLTKKRFRGGIPKKLKWIVFELITLCVSTAEFALLVSTTIQQRNWQPCQMGRWDLGHSKVGSPAPTILGDSETFITVLGDVAVVECQKDPGSDLVWAVVIGVVVVLHSIVLLFELLYISSSVVREAVNVPLNRLRTVFRRRRSPEPVQDNVVLDDHTTEASQLGTPPAARPQDDLPF